MSRRPATLATLRHFTALGRPLHLVGGWLFYGLGVAIARFEGSTLRLSSALYGMLAVTAIQLMTHYSNDYFDLDADRANQTFTRWTGGSRVLPNGLLAPRIGLFAALIFGFIAAIASGWAAFASTNPTLTLLLLASGLVLTWSYSAPPLSFNQRGLGEIMGAFIIPGLTVMVGFAIQAGTLTRLSLLAIVPLVCFEFMQLIAANFPDAAGDAIAGKTTLVVRYGGAPMARVYLAMVVLAYALLPLLALLGLPWQVAALLLLITPIAAWLFRCIQGGGWNDPATWDKLGFWSVGLVVGAALLELAGFVLL